MLIDNRLPEISRLKEQQQVQALHQYLFTLVQQINYVLENIDEQNLSKELRATINDLKMAAQTAATEQRAKETEQHPVGTVYLNVDAAKDPAKLFGGKWEMMDTAASNYFYCWQRKE